MNTFPSSLPSTTEPALPPPPLWLLRIPETFAPDRADILRQLGMSLVRSLGRDYVLVKPPELGFPISHPALRWVPWRLPLHHVWPCRPESIPSFLEKSALALTAKFSPQAIDAFFCGPLEHHPRHRNLRLLASNLRGRTLQVAPPSWKLHQSPESLLPHSPTLYAMVGREGLYAGRSTPSASGGFFPGGIRFFRTSGDDSISRAGAKIAGALHLMPLHHAAPPPPAHWLELGASPGGMTSELLQRGYHVTAIDRAALDPRVASHPNLRFIHTDVTRFNPSRQAIYDALLCDMNGPAESSFEQLLRLAPSLKLGAPAVFTFKTTGLNTPDEIAIAESTLVNRAVQRGLSLGLRTHLAANRHEFTLVFYSTPSKNV